MGATVSHPQHIHGTTTANRGRILSKKYSLPAYLTNRTSSKEKFFPPPILHTKLHDLNTDFMMECTSNDEDAVYKTVPLGKNGRRVMFRKSTVDDSELQSTGRVQSPDSSQKLMNLSNPASPASSSQSSSSQKVIAKMSPSSSTSSGVDSEDFEHRNRMNSTANVNDTSDDENRKSETEGSNQRLFSESFRSSMDSGASYCEDGFPVLTASGDESFETVFEESDSKVNAEELMAKNEFEPKTPEAMTNTDTEATGNESSNDETESTKKLASLYVKKGKKNSSLAKKWRKARARAISLPGTYVAEFLKRREKPSGSLFGSNYLNREWEIVSVQEMSRRLSLDQLDKVVLPLPDGAASSEILDESMARQLVDALPARATGYPWTNIYNSEKHGFSLHTFYRKMIEWNEEMSPILLIIRDCTGNVFGAIVSTAILPSEHFFGTGDSCLLYRFVTDPESGEKDLQTYSWSGENQFFVKASTDSLSVGAGGGHYGLWLDADLNHGRSQKCETFQNDPLCGADEDFTVQFLEAFGFRMT